MPLEIETRMMRPRPRARCRSCGLGAVEPNPTQKTTKGVRVAVRLESNHRVSLEELGLAMIPVLNAQGLQIAGEPRLIVDDSPIWVWQKLMQDPSVPGIKEGDFAWMAVVASGPLKGHEGMVMAPSECTQKYDPKTGQELDWKCVIGTPTVKDTAELPKFVEDWSVLARPADLELPESKVAQLKAALRPVRQQLQTLAGGMVGTQVVVTDVPAPQPPATKAVKAAVGSAAFIGIALAMLTWGRKVGA